MEHSRITPDELADLHDAGCTTGVSNLTGRDISKSDLKRGFSVVVKDPHGMNSVDSFDNTHGFLTRPGGWER